MEINSINSESIPTQPHHTIKCVICQKQLGKGSRIFKEGLNFGVVCEECYKNNSAQDLEFMANVFHAYGGYFGMVKDADFSLYELLKPLSSASKSRDKMNIKALYQALLHGVTPSQYNQGLKILYED